MPDAITAFAVYFGNGLSLEFGDDLYCWARQEAAGADLAACQAEILRWTERLGETQTTAAFAGTLIGYALSPLSVVLSVLAGRARSAGQAFTRGLGLELAEGVLSVIGQIVTGASPGTAFWSLGLSAVIAPIRGVIAAFTHSWARSGLFRIAILAIALAALAGIIRELGITPV